MFQFDAGKIAKDAVQGLEKAEKLGGGAGDVAKSVLQGVKKVEGLAGLQEKAPEQVIAILRKLLEEAKHLAGSLPNKNATLDACIQKAQALLESGDISADAVTKLTAELTALMKGAADGQPAASEPQKAAPKPVATTAPKPAAPAGAPVRTAPAIHEEPPAPKKTVQFSDVQAGAYYYDAVQWAVQKGIASGTTETTFSPDQNCTRAQTITLLWRANGSPAPKSKNNPFSDVKEGAYYCDALLWAAEQGIVSGTAFHPDDATTRGQLAVFLYKNAGSPVVADSSTFTDVPKDAGYSQAVAWVAKQGITSGTGENTFSPEGACTRGQIVTFLYRAKK